MAGVWRAGRKVGRTLYRDDVLVGVMDTPELAAQVVEALNGTASAVDTSGCYCSDYQSSGLPCPMGTCPNRPRGTASGAGGETFTPAEVDASFERFISRNITPSRPQADAIKASISAANNRVADAFDAWDRRDESTPFGTMSAGEFEAWLRSGADAPGAVPR